MYLLGDEINQQGAFVIAEQPLHGSLLEAGNDMGFSAQPEEATLHDLFHLFSPCQLVPLLQDARLVSTARGGFPVQLRSEQAMDVASRIHYYVYPVGRQHLFQLLYHAMLLAGQRDMGLPLPPAPCVVTSRRRWSVCIARPGRHLHRRSVAGRAPSCIRYGI